MHFPVILVHYITQYSDMWYFVKTLKDLTSSLIIFEEVVIINEFKVFATLVV
jgi:hypothetical protein